MVWTEHQQRLLRAMGLRVWVPQALAQSPPLEDARSGDAWALAGATPRVTSRVVEAAEATPSRPAAAPPPLPPLASAAVAHAAMTTDPARAAHVATLDWPELRDAVQACRACGLCAGRTQTVFGVGHAQAHWMVVGEAPGEQEDLHGEPFVGAAGQLLDQMLRALTLTRSADGELPAARRVYIANALKCRPPRNRNPAREEMAACEPFLKRQISLVQPRIILAMGRFAVQALLNTSEPIGRLRGRVHRYQGVPLVVTYHPAYLLRNLVDKARAWEDLCLAAEVAEQGVESAVAPAPARNE